MYWPSITINKVTFRGDITATNILEAICAGLIETPDVCIKFYQEENIPYALSSGNALTTTLIIFIVVLLVGVNFALIMAYKRCAKKEMEEDIGMQVSSAVN